MIRHDYRCLKCSRVYEISFDSALDFRREWPCVNCGGVGVQIWLRAPGLAGVEEPGTRGVSRSFQPGHDIQSGRYFHTRAERDRYVKSRGLELAGPEEWKRTVNALPSDPTPKTRDEDLAEAMQKSWEELQSGNRPPKMEAFKEDEPTFGEEIENAG